MATHVFKDPAFWEHFEHQVQLLSWKCNFPPELLSRDLEEDAKLYTDDAIFRKRRHGVMGWMKDDARWVRLILGACRELADGREGDWCLKLKKLHLLEALGDFVEHLNCFYVVALKMASRGLVVKPLSQDSSRIHDIDKLDPVMLVGYSEKFEDRQNTSVWNECVDRHTHVNPHHQAHCVWHKDRCGEASCPYCRDLADKALAEMVCDKVSRRLQKNLNGDASGDLWNVDLEFFSGLPHDWLDKAVAILKAMQQ